MEGRHSQPGLKTYHVRFPQVLAHAEQLLRRRARDDEVLGKVDTSYAIKAADERLPRLGIQAGDDGADEPGAEAALVEARADEVGEGAGRDVALLAEAVEVHLVAEEFGDARHVGREASEAQEDVAVLEDLGEVVGHGERLHAEAEVAGYGDAVLADHGDGGAAV